MAIDMILMERIYLMLLSYDPDIVNKLIHYILYYTHQQLYKKFLK